MKPPPNKDRIWLALCSLSLLVYGLVSVSTRAFAHEVTRLYGKFLG